MSRSFEMNFQERNIKKIVDYLNVLRTDGGIGGNGLGKKPYSKIHRKLLFLYLNIRTFLTGKVSIAYMDFNVTTRCSLNCKDCCHAMPLYKNSTHVLYNIDTFKKDVNLLLNSVDIIYDFEFLGGEPMLVPDLYKMIQYAATKNQIKNMTMYTNGTVVPSKELLLAMSGARNFLLCISNYSSNPKLSALLKHEEIISLCKKYNIRYHLFPKDKKWIKTDRLYKHNRTQKELLNEWQQCWQRDNLVFCDGKLYACQKSLAIERNLGAKFLEYETVDFRNDKNARKSLKKFFSLPYISACDYCQSDKTKFVSPALQKTRQR